MVKHTTKLSSSKKVWSHVHTAMFKMDIQKDLLYVACETLPKVMWWPVWEGSLGENGYMHMYG